MLLLLFSIRLIYITLMWRLLLVLLVILIGIRILMMRRLAVYRVILILIRDLLVNGSLVLSSSLLRNLILMIARRFLLIRCLWLRVLCILLVLLCLVIILLTCWCRLLRLLMILVLMLLRRKVYLRCMLLFEMKHLCRRPVCRVIMLILIMRSLRVLILLNMWTLWFVLRLILRGARDVGCGLSRWVVLWKDMVSRIIGKSMQLCRWWDTWSCHVEITCTCTTGVGGREWRRVEERWDGLDDTGVRGAGGVGDDHCAGDRCTEAACVGV